MTRGFCAKGGSGLKPPSQRNWKRTLRLTETQWAEVAKKVGISQLCACVWGRGSSSDT